MNNNVRLDRCVQYVFVYVLSVLFVLFVDLFLGNCLRASSCKYNHNVGPEFTSTPLATDYSTNYLSTYNNTNYPNPFGINTMSTGYGGNAYNPNTYPPNLGYQGGNGYAAPYGKEKTITITFDLIMMRLFVHFVDLFFFICVFVCVFFRYFDIYTWLWYLFIW
jgi:hypothetical protein